MMGLIVLPEVCGLRTSARKIADVRDRSPIVDASEVIAIPQSFIDELCKTFIENSVDRVTFINTSERLERFFLLAHRLRQAKFIVEFA